MQSTSSRIWTRIAVSISCDDNHYTTGPSKALTSDAINYHIQDTSFSWGRGGAFTLLQGMHSKNFKLCWKRKFNQCCFSLNYNKLLSSLSSSIHTHNTKFLDSLCLCLSILLYHLSLLVGLLNSIQFSHSADVCKSLLIYPRWFIHVYEFSRERCLWTSFSFLAVLRLSGSFYLDSLWDWR